MLVYFLNQPTFQHLLGFSDVKSMRNLSYLGKRKKKKANVYLGKSGVYWNIYTKVQTRVYDIKWYRPGSIGQY